MRNDSIPGKYEVRIYLSDRKYEGPLDHHKIGKIYLTFTTKTATEIAIYGGP